MIEDAIRKYCLIEEEVKDTTVSETQILSKKKKKTNNKIHNKIQKKKKKGKEEQEKFHTEKIFHNADNIEYQTKN